MQPRQQPLHIATSPHRIAVHPANPRRGKQLLQSLFTLLRAGPQKIKMFALALRTNLRNSLARAAIVTLQSLPWLGDRIVLAHLLVIRHRDRAFLEFTLLPTTAAHYTL